MTVFHVDGETHAMRFLVGLVVFGIGLLVVELVALIGAVGWLVIAGVIGGSAALYLLGTVILGALDRVDR